MDLQHHNLHSNKSYVAKAQQLVETVREVTHSQCQTFMSATVDASMSVLAVLLLLLLVQMAVLQKRFRTAKQKPQGKAPYTCMLRAAFQFSEHPSQLI